MYDALFLAVRGLGRDSRFMVCVLHDANGRVVESRRPIMESSWRGGRYHCCSCTLSSRRCCSTGGRTNRRMQLLRWNLNEIHKVPVGQQLANHLL